MPPAIEYSVRKQNIKFMHNRNQFNTEYFQFIKKLVSCNPHNISNPRSTHEKLVSSYTVEKLYESPKFNKYFILSESRSRRIIHVISTAGFKISILYWFSYKENFAWRSDWLAWDFVSPLDWEQSSSVLVCSQCFIQSSSQVKTLKTIHLIIQNFFRKLCTYGDLIYLFRFCEYLLTCPSTEVRNAFLKTLVFLAHFSLQDGPCSPPLNAQGKWN